MQSPYLLAMTSARTRLDPRRLATQVVLIEAAERLFAAHGVEAVSTRDIAAAIAARNTNVVAYHFGSKDGLIEAIFRHRLPAIDARRGELLAELDAPSEALSALMRIFALPLFEQVDANGRHSYARFVMGLERSGALVARALVSDDFPQTERLLDRLIAHLPHLTRADAILRIRLANTVISSALQLIDDAPDLSPQAARARFEDAVVMATAALAAPVCKGSTP
jgi:AcrR family transcriptional regulator